MLCDRCRKNEANVHVTKIVNGVRYEQNLCMHCAAEQSRQEEMAASGSFGIEQLFNLFRHIGMIGVVMAPGSAPQGRMMGAPDIESLGLTLPSGEKADSAPAVSIEALKAELNSAVANEKFERAAEIRDEIYMLEQKAKQGQA